MTECHTTTNRKPNSRLGAGRGRLGGAGRGTVKIVVNATALSFVLIAAFVHAGWNLAAKRISRGGARFVWAYYSLSAVALIPVMAVSLAVESQRPQWTWLLAASVTAVLHVTYGVVLQRGYAVGDLSVVYRSLAAPGR